MPRSTVRQLQSFTVPIRDGASVRGHPAPDGQAPLTSTWAEPTIQDYDMSPGEKMRIRPQLTRGPNDLDLLDGQRQLFAAEGALSDSQLSLAIIYLTLNKHSQAAGRERCRRRS